MSLSNGNGYVYLVGAGPGDPGLITVKATRALSRTDVVLYDYLAHPNLMSYAPCDAQLISVGKRKGCHSKRQQEIHDLILSYVQQGCTVVRLKGGDPCTFGRAGEEMGFLVENGVPFEVIPGVSSAVGACTYAGIPLTHRELSRSVAFVTGTVCSGDAVDGGAIPDADTLVFFMAMTYLDRIVGHLCAMDRFSEDTPAAVIYKGTLAQERIVEGTLGSIVELCQDAGLEPPSLLIVGEVVALRDSLRYRDQLPLYGRRFWVLRSKAQSDSLDDQLSMYGAEVLRAPMIEIVYDSEAMNRIDARYVADYSMVIFTSPNGVEAFMKGLLDQGLDARHLAGKSLVAVGPKTAEVLKQFGLKADLMPTSYVAEGIGDLLAEDLSGEKILCPTSKLVRPYLSEELSRRGAQVDVLGLYEPVCPPIGDIGLRDHDGVLFTSSSTATHFFKSGLYSGQTITAYCIGDITASTVRQYFDGDVIVASESTVEGLVSSVLDS